MGRKSKRKEKANQSLKTNRISVTNHNDSTLILMKDRISLPAYQNEELEDDDTELQLDFRPRHYFASTLCYACSKRCDDVEFPCEDCLMVTYCSAQHRQENRKSHEQICKILTEVCQKNNALNLAKCLNADDYRSFRIGLIGMIEQSLGRQMELWEREILLYPKLCRICHGSEDLIRCSKCQMEFFCKDHTTDHKDHCDDYKVFRNILAMERVNGFVAPRIPDFWLNEDSELPKNFDELAQVLFGSDYQKIDCISYAALSQVASPALTAFLAIIKSDQFNRKLNRKMLKIHVIGAELQFECANLTVWEKLFLHLLPNVKSLHLEFCGPELQIPDEIARILEKPNLCSNCRAKKRQIDITFHCGKLYHEIKNDKPDMVCLFNPGLYRRTGFANQDTWPATIEKFCDYGIPILVTSYTEIELPFDLQRMREYRIIQIEQVPQQNPFASLRPERNFVSDDVAPLIYKNYFLSIARGIPSKAE